MVILLIIYFKKLKVLAQYHGAEHKCINMVENTACCDELTVDNARMHSRLHLRCGTNLVVLVLPVALIFNFAFDYFFKTISSNDLFYTIFTILLPGLCMELFILLRKRGHNWAVLPGIWMQKHITTREPDERQLEVGLAALKSVLKSE